MAVEACFGSSKLVFIGRLFICPALSITTIIRLIFSCMKVGFIESVYQAYTFFANCKFIILSDFKFDHRMLNTIRRLSPMLSLLHECNFSDCADLGINHLDYTYFL